MRKVGNIFARELDFKDVQFPVKIGDIHKIEKKKKKKKKLVSTLVFLVMKKRKNIQVCVKKYFQKTY